MHSRNLAKTFALVTLLGIAGKAVGFGKEILVASIFGTSPLMDAFLLSTSLPLLLAGALAGSLNAHMVPVMQEYRVQGVEDERRAVSAIFWWVLTITGVSTAIVMLGAPWIVDRVGGLLSPELRRTATTFMRINAFVIVGMCSAYTLQAAFLSHKRYHLVTTLQSLPSVVNVIIVLGLHAILGPLVLPLGFAGGALGMLVAFLVAYRLVLREQLLPTWRHEAARRVMRLSTYLLIGQATLSINDVVDQWMASAIAPGSISSLSYAQRLMDIPVQVCVVGFSTIMLPLFSEQRAEGRTEAMSSLFEQATRYIMYFTLPLMVGILVLGRPLIQMVFERGAFTSQSTLMTYSALAAYAIGLPFLVLGYLNGRLLNAMQDVKVMTVVALLTLPINLGLDWFLTQFWSHSGIALSTSVVRLFSYVLILRSINKKYLNLRLAGILSSLCLFGASAFVMGAVVAGVDRLILFHFALAVRLLVGGVVGGLTYFFITWLLRCPEPRQLLSQFVSRTRRNAEVDTNHGA